MNYSNCMRIYIENNHSLHALRSFWKPRFTWFISRSTRVLSCTATFTKSTTSSQVDQDFILCSTASVFCHSLNRILGSSCTPTHAICAVPIGLTSEYAHPVEELLANAIPTLAGPLLFGNYDYFVSM